MTLFLLVLISGTTMFFLGGVRLPILMYHKVRPSAPDELTVPLDVFKQHLDVIARRGYHTISFSDLLDHEQQGTPLPAKPILLTFDDAYADFSTHPLTWLKEHGFGATIFLPVGHVGGENAWDGGGEPIMNWDDVRGVAEHDIEIGLHSWSHVDYRNLDPEEIEADLQRCMDTLDAEAVPYTRVLAYPYGGLPKESTRRTLLGATLQKLRITYGVRIGSRVERLPIRNRLALRRVPMEGKDTGFRLAMKLALGRIRF